MLVREIKKLEPKAELFELDKNCKYLVLLPNPVSSELMRTLRRCLDQAEIQNCVVLCGIDIEVFGLEDSDGTANSEVVR